MCRLNPLAKKKIHTNKSLLAKIIGACQNKLNYHAEKAKITLKIVHYLNKTVEPLRIHETNKMTISDREAESTTIINTK